MATESKDIRKLLQQVARLDGWRVEYRSGGYRIFPPEGQTPFSAPHGPRNPYRAMHKLKSQLRRAGAEI